MPARLTSAPRPAAALLVVALLAGCGGSDDDGAPEGGGRSASTAEALAPTGAATADPGATAEPGATAAAPSLPTSCAGLLPSSALADAYGQPLPGGQSFLYADELPASGRTGRVTCEYGVAEAAATPTSDGAGAAPQEPADDRAPVEVSLIGYVDEATAAGRIDVTVTSAQERGAQVLPQPVGGRDGYLLLLEDEATLVVADANRTVVVGLLRGNVPEDQLGATTARVAEAVLAANPPAAGAPTSGTASPSPTAQP